jgi:tRNA C32,U32 (ribose-2'-O)-methylase TrmJ
MRVIRPPPSINKVRQQPNPKQPTDVFSKYSIYASAQLPAKSAPNRPKTLEAFKLVLVSPKIPGNIGSTARLVANFEFASLAIVSPRCNPLSDEAFNLAVNAEHILCTCSIVPTLSDALGDCTSAIAFTRRAGSGRVVHPSLTSLFQSFPDLLVPHFIPYDDQDNKDDEIAVKMETSAPSVDTMDNSNHNKVALVFGREESGLTDEEVMSCSLACSISTGTMQPSLNLSHSVAVVGSWLFEKISERRNSSSNSGGDKDWYKTRKEREVLEPATLEEVEALMAKIIGLMERAGIDARESAGGENSGRRRMMAGHIRSVLLRARVSESEVRSMHGLVKEVDKRVGK